MNCGLYENFALRFTVYNKAIPNVYHKHKHDYLIRPKGKLN
jgi:hypothetical protein